MLVGLAGFKRLMPIPNDESCDWTSSAMFSHVASVDWAFSRVRVSWVPLEKVHGPPAVFCVKPAFSISEVALLMFRLYGLSCASQELPQIAPS